MWLRWYRKIEQASFFVLKFQGIKQKEKLTIPLFLPRTEKLHKKNRQNQSGLNSLIYNFPPPSYEIIPIWVFDMNILITLPRNINLIVLKLVCLFY